MEPFSANSALGGQLSFQVPPESFQTVNMVALAVGVFVLAVIYQPVDIFFGGDSGIAAPGIGANR